MNIAVASGPVRIPLWLRQEIPSPAAWENIRLLKSLKLNTVCQTAHCPNLAGCFKRGELTFIILGDTCTRGCGFCAVDKATSGSLGIDDYEPERIAEAASRLCLDYVVITSVTRDDLEDGGAGHFARTIKLIHAIGSNVNVEALIPDFQGNLSSIKTVVNAAPEVLGHNLETVSRLSPVLRPQADYGRSLQVLKTIKQVNPEIITKSSLMLGLGENEEEIIATMQELRKVDCDILALGQYLAPSLGHYPVQEFIAPGEFIEYRNIALSLGFKAVSSAPLARSSYKARDLYRRAECMM